MANTGHPNPGNFANDREKAAEAGRKGGQASGGHSTGGRHKTSGAGKQSSRGGAGGRG
nr:MULTISPECIES: KGG domain-containing protein [unclassified Pseudomonas]